MKDEKKNPQEKTQNNNVRKLTSRRWFYPALYLCVVALIVSAVLWSQAGSDKPNADKNQTNNDQLAADQSDKDAVPVIGVDEVFKWPVADKDAVSIVTPFYDVDADAEQQQKALVTYDNMTTQNTGVCIAAKDGKTFDVQASMSGKVIKATKDPVLGNVVELQHKDGVVTRYESLDSLKVEKGQEVNQGQVLGTAGKSEYNAEAGIHLHFEIRKDNVAVNPESYFQKGLASLDDVKSADHTATVTNATPDDSANMQDNAENSDLSNNPANSNMDNKNNNDNSANDNNSNDNNSNDNNSNNENNSTNDNNKMDTPNQKPSPSNDGNSDKTE